MSLWKYSVGTFGDLFAPLLRLLFDVEGLTFDNFYYVFFAAFERHKKLSETQKL